MMKKSFLGCLRPVAAAAVAATALLASTGPASAGPGLSHGYPHDDRFERRGTVDHHPGDHQRFERRVAVHRHADDHARFPRHVVVHRHAGDHARTPRHVAAASPPRAAFAPGDRLRGPRHVPSLRPRFDLDRDGALDAYERASLAEHLRQASRRGDTRWTGSGHTARLVRAHDLDRDGHLNDRELWTMLRNDSLMQVFAATDRNHDRMLAYVELDAMPMLESLRRADLDRSGYVSWQELDRYVSADDLRGRTARRSYR